MKATPTYTGPMLTMPRGLVWLAETMLRRIADEHQRGEIPAWLYDYHQDDKVKLKLIFWDSVLHQGEPGPHYIAMRDLTDDLEIPPPVE